MSEELAFVCASALKKGFFDDIAKVYNSSLRSHWGIGVPEACVVPGVNNAEGSLDFAGIIHAMGHGEPSAKWYGQQAVYRVSMGNFVSLSIIT